jgi:DNA-binding MarR family transcriptional regulator
MTELLDAIHQLMFLSRPKPRAGDLSVGERMVLRTVHQRCKTIPEGILPSQLSEILGISRSAMTPLLNALETGGYLIRQVDPTNRRQIRITPTTKLDPSRQRRHQLVDESVARLSPQEQDQLLSLLNKLNAYLADEDRHA